MVGSAKSRVVEVELELSSNGFGEVKLEFSLVEVFVEVLVDVASLPGSVGRKFVTVELELPWKPSEPPATDSGCRPLANIA